MQYKCDNCRRRFAFDDFIEFCPYCGKAFDELINRSSNSGLGSDIAKAIDSIWGDAARVRNEFTSVVSKCITLINSYAESTIKEALPNEDISKHEKYYASIKQSNNRKTLIVRIDGFLNYLDDVIDELSDRIPSDSVSRLENAVNDTEDAVKELYDFLGIRYEKPNIDFFSEDNYSAEVLYTRDQLRYLYDLVMIAYSKYKKCVEDNNMFAAFASTSNYGVMTDYWRRWLSKLSQVGEGADKKENPQYEAVVEHLKAQNAKKYYGMLDEDFVPHVDAFWYGLEILCEFIDHHIAVCCNTDCIYIDDEERSKILRTLASQDYDVSEERLDGAMELKKRLEARQQA